MTTSENLRRELASGRERLLAAIAGVSEEQFKRRPAIVGHERPWSIAEVLAHLLQQERLRGERIARAIADDGAMIEPSSQEEYDRGALAGRMSPVPQLIHGLLASRRELERLLDEAEPGKKELRGGGKGARDEHRRRGQSAPRYRRRDRRLRAAAEGGALLQGALPLPHREDAFVLRLPGAPELALLRRLRHRRRRHRLRRQEGEPRFQQTTCACWPTAPAWSCAATARVASRSRRCRTPTRRRRSTSTACCRTRRPTRVHI